jgi:hypothetical protein
MFVGLPHGEASPVTFEGKGRIVEIDFGSSYRYSGSGGFADAVLQGKPFVAWLNDRQASP